MEGGVVERMVGGGEKVWGDVERLYERKGCKEGGE